MKFGPDFWALLLQVLDLVLRAAEVAQRAGWWA